MSEKKNWSSTVMGWFVVREGEELDATPSDSSGAPAEPAPPAIEPVAPLPEATGGQVDFDAVFAAFGIDADSRARLQKAADLLHNLPAAAEPAVKRQIVEASLKAFGIPIEGIVEAGCEQLQAIDAYLRKGGDDLQAYCSESEQRIAALEGEIKRLRTAMGQRADEQKSVLTLCNARRLDVQQVLEFFGQETVARVVRESPKLVDPGQGR